MTDVLFHGLYVLLLLFFLGWFLAGAAHAIATRCGVTYPKTFWRFAILGIMAVLGVVAAVWPLIQEVAYTLTRWNLHGQFGGFLAAQWASHGTGILIGVAMMLLGGWLVARWRNTDPPDDDIVYGQ